MHARIDDGIGNEECKTMFKHELQKGMEKLRENIEWRFKECEKRFVKEIKKILNNLKRGLKIL
ncbi:hypothetical protein HpMMM16_09440 [Helicobacter pylori]